jgi:formylglycine-generating enzyme required for sulfatase activity
MRIGLGRKGLLSIAALGLLFAATLLPGCSSDNGGPTRPPDTLPPATTSLQIDRVAPTRIKLSWSAPGDDGWSGRAATYDMRYSNDPLGEESWAQATVVPGLEPPGFARQRESVIVEELSSDLTYYFALRTRDEASNWSELSPTINVTLPGAVGAPALWGGRIVNGAGSENSAFIFQLREKLEPGTSLTPGVLPYATISGVPHLMRLVEGSAGDPLYEYDTKLAVGSYEFYFTLTNEAGQTTRLPSPDTWAGPTVTPYQTSGLDVVRVEPGTFVMGNSAAPDTLERPERTVTLTHPFLIDRFEVTNAQLCEALNWARSEQLLRVEDDTVIALAATGETVLRVAPRRGVTAHGIQFGEATGFTPMPYREDLPATFVTWYGAALYCNVRSWLAGMAPAYVMGDIWESIPRRNPYGAEGWRLPTEAEWEYVAQFNDGRLFPTGNTLPRPGIEGNFGLAFSGVTPTGQFPDGATALGLRDLLGNAWEWCHDWKATYDETALTNPVQARPRSSRIVRGGSWGSNLEELRCTKRFGQPPGHAYDGLGFRCVRVDG